MQETLTSEIYNQIDCMKLHLRNMQEVAEIEKMLPVNCLELHKGISVMEQALVHFMNFEKLLKNRKEQKKVSPISIVLDTAIAETSAVEIEFNADFLKGVELAYEPAYLDLKNKNPFVGKAGKNYILNYDSGEIAIPVSEVAEYIISVKLVNNN